MVIDGRKCNRYHIILSLLVSFTLTMVAKKIYSFLGIGMRADLTIGMIVIIKSTLLRSTLTKFFPCLGKTLLCMFTVENIQRSKQC